MNNSSILVISDSHGNVPALTTALAWVRNTVLSAAIFLGDGADDLSIASSRAGFTLPWHKVRGNGDFNFLIPDTLVLEIPFAEDIAPTGKSDSASSRTLFLAHGNRHGVDGGGHTIAQAAKDAGAEAALFGHLHVPHCSFENGIFLLNPGSIGRSRSNAGPTFAVLECPAKGPLSARFFCLVNRDRNVEEFEL